jgi:uncharacterized protein (TIGR00106 family)
MLLAEFSMFPLDKGESLSSYVARSLEIIDGSGLPYRLGPMGTTIEGEWDEVMGVIKKCYERMNEDCDRVECSIKIDYRSGAGGRLEKKIESIENKLGRKLQR